jgi:hypothetical protein
MVVHFRVSKTQQQQQQQQGQELLAVGASSEYLLLLLPVGEQHLLGSVAGAAGVPYLPYHQLMKLLSLDGAMAKACDSLQQQYPYHQQQQGVSVSVQVAKPLSYQPGLDVQLSPVASQYSHCVSCIHPPSNSDYSYGISHQPHPHQQQQQQEQQQQQQYSWLNPRQYPWLSQALQQGCSRLAPRLSLPSWQCWQGVGVPLPGGVLLVGGPEGGRGWLLQLLGQAAAEQQGVHVLKVSQRTSGRFLVLVVWVWLYQLASLSMGCHYAVLHVVMVG